MKYSNFIRAVFVIFLDVIKLIYYVRLFVVITVYNQGMNKQLLE